MTPEAELAWLPLAREALDFARALDGTTVTILGHSRPEGRGGVMELQVVDNPDKARFEILADGEIAGFLDYSLRAGEIAFLHAETDGRFRGQGVAGYLVESSLDSARARHLAVLPYCPFVRGWIADHPAYADLIPEGKRQRFGL